MKRLIAIAVLAVLVALIVMPETAGPGDIHNSVGAISGQAIGVGHALRLLITAARDFLSLLASLTIDFANAVWRATPERLKPLYGLIIILGSVFSTVGLLSLGAALGLSRRLFD
jgi:hypothetical protein